MKIKLLLMIAMLATTSAPASAAPPAAFEVGAAVADATPPPFDPQSHTPPIDPPALDGARQWDFTEPYVDSNGNGYWDPGEPYAELRRAFVYKEKPSHTPLHLARHRTHSPRWSELPRLAS